MTLLFTPYLAKGLLSLVPDSSLDFAAGALLENDVLPALAPGLF
jgi:hypothetical protein